MEDGENPAAVGGLFAEYLCELSDIMGNPSFYETDMPEFAGEETLHAIAMHDRPAIFRQMIEDLTDLIGSGVCME